MQTDPIGYGDGMNMYRYVGNDPVNGVDPSGMCEGADICHTYSPGLSGSTTDDRPWIYPVPGGGGGAGVGGGSGPPPTTPDGACFVFPDAFQCKFPAPAERDPSRDDCEWGNSLARISKDSGEASVTISGVGAGIAIAGLVTPAVPDGEAIGGALIGVGSGMGYFSAGAQIMSGLYQGSATGDYGNAYRAFYGLGLSFLVGRGYSLGVPPADNTRRGRFESRVMMQTVAKAGGASFAVIQSLDPNVAPREVTCH